MSERPKLAPIESRFTRLKIVESRPDNRDPGELTRELESARQRVKYLEAQNRRLKREIQEVIERGKHLERVVGTMDNQGDTEPSFQIFPQRPAPSLPKAEREIRPVPEVRPTISKKSSRREGWLMAAAVLFVVLTSGLGTFLLVSHARR